MHDIKKRLEEIFDFTEYRMNYINWIFCIMCLFLSLVLPSVFAYIIHYVIKDKMVCSLIGSILFATLVLLIYFKDIKKEFKIFTKDFNKNINTVIKYYILGIVLTYTFSLLLYGILKESSQNETLVREYLFDRTWLMLISIVIVAPFTEEIVYRKSVGTVFHNKWVFAIISAILFGGAHIMTNVFSGTFVLTDLLYILPYGSYGFAFALMDYDTETTFSSIMIHSIHNLLNAII